MTPTAAGRKSDLLSGKRAVVTGGARGIGAAVTRVLLDHGARVTVLGRSAEPQPGGALDFKRSSDLAYVKADVGDPAAVAHAFGSARARFGPINILVNNAGQAASAPFLKTDSTLWRRMMTVNLDGTFHCIQVALPEMLSAGWGRIINMASTAGLTGYAYVAAYCASKHAVVGLTRALALEVATKSVTGIHGDRSPERVCRKHCRENGPHARRSARRIGRAEPAKKIGAARGGGQRCCLALPSGK